MSDVLRHQTQLLVVGSDWLIASALLPEVVAVLRACTCTSTSTRSSTRIFLKSSRRIRFSSFTRYSQRRHPCH